MRTKRLHLKSRKYKMQFLRLLPVFLLLLQVLPFVVQAAELPRQANSSSALNGQKEREKVTKALEDAVRTGSPTAEVNIDDDPTKVQVGDLVRVNYSATLENGDLILSTHEKDAKDPGRKKVTWFTDPRRYGAEEIVAGRQELFPGVGEGVIGMGPGEKKHIVLSPEQAFGPVDPQRRAQYPTVRTISRITSIGAEDYVKQFGSFPSPGKELDLIPYFKAKVTKVGDRDVTLEFLAKDSSRFEEEFGTMIVKVVGDTITMDLTPRIGASFPANDQMGKIVAVEGEFFTVDFNHPLTGKTIALDLEVVSLTKASNVQAKPIDWVDGHDSSLAQAKKDGKPVFMVLYADWCGWCKKIFSESAEDPRIKNLRDRFVWAKVNSDKEKKYKQQYGQDGYPMLVLLRPDGTVAQKIEGYRDGAALGKVLKEFLESQKPFFATDTHRQNQDKTVKGGL